MLLGHIINLLLHSLGRQYGEIFSSLALYCPSLRSGQYCHPRAEYFPILPSRSCNNIYLLRMRTYWQAMWLIQSASQETRYSFARKAKDTQHRIACLYEAYMDNLGSQPLLFRHRRAAVGECVCRSSFCPTHFQNIWFSLELVLLLAMSVDVVPDFRFAAKRSILHWDRLASSELPLVRTHARTHAHTHARTDKCNLSIKMHWLRSTDCML